MHSKDMKLPQEKIDKAYKIAQKVFEVSLVLLLAFGLMIFTKPLFGMVGFSIETMTYYPAIRQIYKGIIAICGIGALCGVFPTLIFSLIASDNEKQQRKEEIKEALREIEDENKQSKRKKIDNDVICPLKGLTPQQIDVIVRFLNDIHVDNGHVKTSDLKHLLLALKRQDVLDDRDMDGVIRWVEEVTSNAVDSRNLKYDYDTKYSEKEIGKWGDRIRNAYDKIEIS